LIERLAGKTEKCPASRKQGKAEFVGERFNGKVRFLSYQLDCVSIRSMRRDTKIDKTVYKRLEKVRFEGGSFTIEMLPQERIAVPTFHASRLSDNIERF
jgi:hypothetical protein